jgi:hypothetical protein
MVMLRVQETRTANVEGKSERMAQTESVQRILTQNQGRDPERLQRKYAAMRRDPFTLLRGTCHYPSVQVGQPGLQDPSQQTCFRRRVHARMRSRMGL